MESREVIGVIAAFLTTGCYLPQVIKVIKTKSTHDISLLMFIIFCFGIIMWFVYGLMLQSISLIIGNIITFCLAMIILVYKIKYK